MERYLPTKRHRVLRTRYVENNIDVEIKELLPHEFPIAFIVHDYQSVYKNAKNYQDFTGHGEFRMFSEEIRTYNRKLYKPVRVTHGAAISLIFESLDFIKDEISLPKPYDLFGEDFTNESIIKEDNTPVCKEEILENAKKYVIFDGKVWKTCGEPMYTITTFGLGHNHGGTGFFIQYNYSPNIRNDNYFNALEREDAISYGKRIALERGDTKSIEGMGNDDIIEVLLPEMVTRNPKKEYGHESSSLEAGLIPPAI